MKVRFRCKCLYWFGFHAVPSVERLSESYRILFGAKPVPPYYQQQQSTTMIGLPRISEPEAHV